MIELRNIYKKYGNEYYEINALNNININIDRGDFISIMGPSGCGKSTLLNIIGCLDSNTTGEYIYNNNKVDKLNQKQLSLLRNREFAFIFQNFALIRELNVIENITLPLEFSGKRKIDIQKIEEYMSELGILEFKNRKISTLSGGQQQRVAITRALVQESNIILADEPTGALDETNSIKIIQLLKMLNEKYNKTVIVVTHDKNIASVAKKNIKMKDGRIEE